MLLGMIELRIRRTILFLVGRKSIHIIVERVFVCARFQIKSRVGGTEKKRKEKRFYHLQLCNIKSGFYLAVNTTITTCDVCKQNNSGVVVWAFRIK